MYDVSREQAEGVIRNYLKSRPDAHIIIDEANYIYAEFDGTLGSTDDVEFQFPSDDNIVHFRSSTRADTRNDFGANRDRMEKIRNTLRFEKVPVIMGWDPKYNPDQKTWLEYFFQPLEPLFQEISKSLY